MSRSFARLMLPLATVVVVAALGACGTIAAANKGTALDQTLYDFSSDIRWGDFDAAYGFVDPASKTAHPLTTLDRERYKQVEISSYEVMSKVEGPAVYDQQVRLELINRNTQIPRSVTYHEHWRWDETKKQWLLESGLPDITADL